MNMVSLLNDKTLKPIQKREAIVEAIKLRVITIKEIQPLIHELDDKKMALIVEAMEAVTGKNPEIANLEWLELVQQCMDSESNSLIRESSRVIGNIAHLFPNNLETAIHKLMANVKHDGTVIRWGSAYALARIIVIPQHANSDLYNVLSDICEQETDNGVKNQYLGGLKKAKKRRE